MDKDAARTYTCWRVI